MTRPTAPPEKLPRTRAEFFDCELHTWRALTATWRALPPAALLQPGACGRHWSVKDVMNHVAAWQEAALQATADLLEGRWAHLGYNTDRFNALHYAADHSRSLADTRRRLERARAELLVRLSRVRARQLLNVFGRQQIGWWAKFSTYGHYSEHILLLDEFRRRMQMRP